jgi:hypothetical protein
MLTTDRVAGVALVVVGLYVLWESRVLPLGTLWNPGPAYVPVVLALLVMLLGLLTAGGGAAAPHVARVGWPEWRRAAVIVGVCVFAALALERLGWRVTIALALAFLVGVVERKGVVAALVFALGLALGTHYLFDTVLRVPLPRGFLGL